MKILKVCLGIAVLLAVVFFLYSFWIAPYSVHHGYYLGAAKLMAEGLVPYRDFNIIDFPLGIYLFSILYEFVGGAMNGNVAVVFLMIIHVMNFCLLSLIFKKMQIRSIYAWIGLLFYILILYSSDALMVNPEPIAVFFLEVSILFILCGKSISRVIFSSLLFVFAVFCKYEVVVIFPVMALFILFSRGKKQKRDMVMFSLYSISFAIIFYAFLRYYCDAEILRHLVLNVYGIKNWYFIVSNIIIFGGRCSLFFILPIFVCFKNLKQETIVYSLIALVSFFMISLCFVCEVPSSIGQFAYPFLAISFSLGLQDIVKGKKWMLLFYVSVFFIPAFLCFREFQKLEKGHLKEEQIAYLELLQTVIPENSKVSVMSYHCFEYDFCSQLFAEIPTVRPFDLESNWWGKRDWWFVDQYDFTISSMKHADVIIMNHDFESQYFGFDSLHERKWGEIMDDYKGTHESMSIGDFSVFFNNN